MKNNTLQRENKGMEDLGLFVNKIRGRDVYEVAVSPRITWRDSNWCNFSQIVTTKNHTFVEEIRLHNNSLFVSAEFLKEMIGDESFNKLVF